VSSARVVTDADWSENEINLWASARAIGERWTWVVIGALVGAVAAFALASRQPIVYEASTTLLVSYPARTGVAETSPQALTSILNNGSLASQVVSETGLDRPPHALTAQRFLAEALTIESVAGTNVMRVRVKLGDPALAAEASRRLSDKAIQLARALNDQGGTAIQEQLRAHLAAALERLSTAEQELLAFRQKAQVEVLRADTDTLLEQRDDLRRLDVALARERARLAAAEKEIARQERILPAARAVGSEEAMRRTGSVGRDTWESGSVDPESLDFSNPFVNPVYQTLDFQIASSRTSLAALEQERRQLIDVSKVGGTGLAPLSELYGREAELARRQANFELAQKVHSDLSVRYEESRTVALGNSPLLQLVDAALPPDRPLPRRRLRLITFGLITGAVLAALAALVQRRT
jgi:uncharacterized protein involved in exopolysaccharide biosynthesis